MLRLEFADQTCHSLVQLMSAGLLIGLSTSPSTLGLVMNFVIQITSQFNTLVQTRATLEADFTSVIRIWEYAALEPESHPDEEETRTRTRWPQNPVIQFDSFTMSYEAGGRPCLRDVNISISPGEHVAIVGRTGAGKSSFALALLRGVGADSISTGRVTIDGVDIADMSLDTLRRRVTLMPQEPLIFNGTLRDNLDIEGHKSDAELMAAIDECQLRQMLNIAPEIDPLEFCISSSG